MHGKELHELTSDLTLMFLDVVAFFTFVAAVNWAANEHLKSGEVLNWPYVFAWLSAIASTAAVPFIWLELQLPNFYDRQKNGRDNVEAALQREKEMGYIGPAM